MVTILDRPNPASLLRDGTICVSYGGLGHMKRATKSSIHDTRRVQGERSLLDITPHPEYIGSPTTTSPPAMFEFDIVSCDEQGFALRCKSC
jgi:hypothetical protein